MEVTALAMMFLTATQEFNLPEGMLSAICYVESGHRIHARHDDDGGSPSLGICEIKITTATMLGFTGTEKQLMRPKTNIHYAAKYLAYQIKRYKDPMAAISAYNMGTYKEGENGFPRNQKYVNKVFSAWLEKK